MSRILDRLSRSAATISVASFLTVTISVGSFLAATLTPDMLFAKDVDNKNSIEITTRAPKVKSGGQPTGTDGKAPTQKSGAPARPPADKR